MTEHLTQHLQLQFVEIQGGGMGSPVESVYHPLLYPASCPGWAAWHGSCDPGGSPGMDAISLVPGRDRDREALIVVGVSVTSHIHS